MCYESSFAEHLITLRFYELFLSLFLFSYRVLMKVTEMDTRIFYLQPRPHRKIAAPRCRRWTHFQGPWTIPRYRDRSSSYPARWNPSQGGTSSHHLSSHLPRIHDRPPLAAAHGDPFQGKDLVPLTETLNILSRGMKLFANANGINSVSKKQLFLM